MLTISYINQDSSNTVPKSPVETTHFAVQHVESVYSTALPADIPHINDFLSPNGKYGEITLQVKTMMWEVVPQL